VTATKTKTPKAILIHLFPKKHKKIPRTRKINPENLLIVANAAVKSMPSHPSAPL